MRGDRLIQEPVPEVSNLRRGRCWKARHEAIEPEEIKPLAGLRGSSLDIELILDRCGLSPGQTDARWFVLAVQALNAVFATFCG